jgi:hypothetical protein
MNEQELEAERKKLEEERKRLDEFARQLTALAAEFQALKTDMFSPENATKWQTYLTNFNGKLTGEAITCDTLRVARGDLRRYIS